MDRTQIITEKTRLPQILPEDLFTHLPKIKIKRPEIRVVYFGTPDFSGYVLEKLIEGKPSQQPIVVQSVVTQADKPIGRRQEITPSIVGLVAKKHGIPVLKPEKLNDEFLKNHLSLLSADLFIVVAYGKILPQDLLDIPKFGALNIHPSLLPKYRGPSPIQTAILNGDKVSGVTIIKMDTEMDHGPIVSTTEISVSEHDNTQSLGIKLFTVGADLLVKTIHDFVEGKIKPKPQNSAAAEYCYKITKESGYFNINNPPPPEQLDRMIRAYYPWPTVWTKWSPNQPQKERPCEAKIIKFLPGGLVQMEGKEPTPLKDFLNGYPNFPIKSL